MNEKDFFLKFFLGLIDLPKIFDFVVLYSSYNFKLVSKIVNRLFTTYPSFNNELTKTVPIISKVFVEIRKKSISQSIQPAEFEEVFNN